MDTMTTVSSGSKPAPTSVEPDCHPVKTEYCGSFFCGTSCLSFEGEGLMSEPVGGTVAILAAASPQRASGSEVGVALQQPSVPNLVQFQQ